jgi:hypothetical protein
MLECINNCVKNVKNNYYGYNPLYPTGPGLLGNIYFNGDYTKIEKFALFNSLAGNCILNRNRVVMRHYPEYRDEQQKYSTKDPSYYKLWNERKIYIL